MRFTAPSEEHGGHMQQSIYVEWVKMFPDPKQRPARMVMPQLGDADALILCDVTAVA